MQTEADMRQFVDSLVQKGLRAQLQTGNLLTGQLFVDMDFHEDAVPAEVDWSGKYPVLPTVQQSIEELTGIVSRLVKRIEAIPLEQMSAEIQEIVLNLNESILLVRNLLHQVRSEIQPEAMATLSQANKTLAAMEAMISADSPLNQGATRTLEELAGAARSMRILVDYLERHPDALIYGKGAEH